LPALASAQTWDTLAPLPAPRYSGAAVAFNNMVYYLGGSVTGSVKSAAVFAYNPLTDSWTFGDSMLTARHRFGAVECNASLYVFGGWGNGGELLNSAECYDPVGQAWTPIETMPTRRASLFAGTANGKVYAIGGWNGTAAADAVEAFDPGTGHWTQLRPMLFPRSEGITGTPDNTIICTGGTTNGSDILDRVDRYDPAQDTWFDCTPIPVARVAGAGATETHKVYVYGGVGPGGTNTHAAHRFWLNAWVEVSSIPSSRRYLAGCYLRPDAYAIGGLDSLMQPTALVEALELPMAIEEEWSRPLPSQPASLVRDRWVNPSTEPATLCDAAGRTVLTLRPGANDLSRLSSGVYLSVTRDRLGRTIGVARITKLE
jgi:hypothetical protein